MSSEEVEVSVDCEGKMNECASTDLEIVKSICRIAGFVVANVIQSETEWFAWGLPYLQFVVSAQFDSRGTDAQEFFATLAIELEPVINHKTGTSLWLELVNISCDSSDRSEEYILVKSTRDRLSELQASLSVYTEEVLQQSLITFLNNLTTSRQTSLMIKDSRSKEVSRKIIGLLHSSLQCLSVQESLELDATQPSHEGVSLAFHEQFTNVSKSIPRHSLVVPYRLWRVGVVAAGGGAIVGMASALAAPTIMSSFIPVLSSAATFVQASAVIDTFLSYTGFITYPLLPGLFGTYGLTVAGRMMMERTKELQEFSLLPLHLLCLPRATLKEIKVRKIDSKPLYLLVSGHLEQEVDQRVVWGADGGALLLEPDHEQNEDDPTDKSANEQLQLEVQREALVMKSVVESSLVESVSEEWNKVVMEKGWWRELHPESSEEFILQWEPDLLKKLKSSISKLIMESVYSNIYSRVKNMIIDLAAGPLFPLKEALSLPRQALSKLQALDDDWMKALDRARQAGHLLAQTLLQQRREFPRGGHKALSLVGYGMGARLIFHCLEVLSSSGEEGKGIVQDAVLIGAPVSTNISSWIAARSVVAGRFINVFSRYDWVLALLYRSKSFELGVAGLYPVQIHPSTAGNKAASDTYISGIKVVQSSGSSDSSSNSDSSIEITISNEHHVHTVEALATLCEKRGIENIDVTDLLGSMSHSEYPSILPAIMKRVNLI